MVNLHQSKKKNKEEEEETIIYTKMNQTHRLETTIPVYIYVRLFNISK